MRWDLEGVRTSTCYNIKPPEMRASTEDHLDQVSARVGLWRFTVIIDVERPSPLWAGPFPRQGVFELSET